jgi:uncharacterized protein (DUF2336 family)
LQLTLIGELEWRLSQASPQRCADLLMHITDLFVTGSRRFADPVTDVFDEILLRLALRTDGSARAMLARRLASLRAPVRIIQMLAEDDDIAVAQVVLTHSEQLDEPTLLYCARLQSQEHLRAIAQRQRLSEAVVEVVLERGNDAVLRALAGNPGANISETGFAVLVQHARGDDQLATIAGLRPDIPHQHLLALLTTASQAVWKKLTAANVLGQRCHGLIEPCFHFGTDEAALLAV